MRIVCVGGGPGGLFFAITSKLRSADHEITVFERNPPDVTYGWGVTFTDDLLDVMHRYDPVSARQVRDHSVVWQELRTSLYGGRSAYGRGYGFSLQRMTLLQILGRRATELGVEIRYRSPVEDLSSCPDADLVVAADGANSLIRQSMAGQFGTESDAGSNLYIWLGTEAVFDDLLFALERTEAGLIWLQAYPSGADVSTCVVECSPHTLQGLGLEPADAEQSTRVLSEIFAEVLGGRPMLNRSSGARWRHFQHVRNTRWYSENVVLLGDAAHTTHFTLAAGTIEAMGDAASLSSRLHRYPDVAAALASYDRRRRPELDQLQAEARESMAYYERIDDYAHLDAMAFADVIDGRNAALRRAGPAARLWQTGAARTILRGLDSRARRRAARRRGWSPGG